MAAEMERRHNPWHPVLELTPTLDLHRLRWLGASAVVGASLLAVALALWWAISIDYRLGREITALKREVVLYRAETVAREGCWREAYRQKSVNQWVDGWVSECAKGRLDRGKAEVEKRVNGR